LCGCESREKEKEGKGEHGGEIVKFPMFTLKLFVEQGWLLYSRPAFCACIQHSDLLFTLVLRL
jgi:hypothetical protein